MSTLIARAALRARPYPCRTSDNDPGMLLCVKDVGGLLESSFVAVWRGPEALEFCRKHSKELVPGRCLDIELSRLRMANHELRADVHACALAPLAPSWQHAKDQPANPT